MRRFFVYTGLQIKRALRFAPYILLMTAALCLCLGLALSLIVRADSSSEDKQKISVGAVGDFNNSFLGFGLSALKSMDSTRFSLDITELDSEESAKRSLLSGEITGYAVIPEDFVDEALHGNVGKLSFVTTDEGADMVNMFKKDVLGLISKVLVESQNGVYGMRAAMREAGASAEEISKMTDEVALEYVGLILNRSNALKVEVIGVSDSLSFGAYMLSALSVLFMLLSGALCCPLFVKSDLSMQKLLRSRRYGSLGCAFGEYTAYFIVIGANFVLMQFLMIKGAALFLQGIPELSGMGTGQIFLTALCSLPAIALITAFQYLLYQLSDSVVSGALMQFGSGVILSYISGCFYPISFFPKGIRILSSFLPSGLAREYLSLLTAGEVSLLKILIPLAYGAVLVMLSAAVLRRRTANA